MSHVVMQKTRIKNLEALRLAVEELKGKMEVGSTFKFEACQEHSGAAHVISFPGVECRGFEPCELGVMPDRDGEEACYSLAGSTYSRGNAGINRIIGEPYRDPEQRGGEPTLAPALMQKYNMHVVALEARAQGCDVEIFEENRVPKMRVIQYA